MLKSFLAYQNKKIKKTHNLIELYKSIIDYIEFNEDELDILDLITTYHIKEAYPPMYRNLPSRDEIKEVLEFSEKLFNRVCGILDIEIE